MSAAGRRWRAAARIDPARFEAVRRGALRGHLARDLDPRWCARLLADPDAVAASGAVLKDDRSATVVALEGGALVLKRHRFPDGLRALRRAPRRSRARRAFLASLRLEAFDIGVAAPLGFLERRHYGIASASWLLSRGLGGRDAGALLRDEGLDDAARARLVDRLLELVLRLQRSRVVHGDLKATNFLVDASGVRLLDLHAVVRARRAGAAGLARDRRRFLRNLDPWPALRARAALCLGH